MAAGPGTSRHRRPAGADGLHQRHGDRRAGRAAPRDLHRHLHRRRGRLPLGRAVTAAPPTTPASTAVPFVPPGDYVVGFIDLSGTYVNEYYDDHLSFFDGDLVTVTAGADTDRHRRRARARRPPLGHGDRLQGDRPRRHRDRARAASSTASGSRSARSSASSTKDDGTYRGRRAADRHLAGRASSTARATTSSEYYDNRPDRRGPHGPTADRRRDTGPASTPSSPTRLTSAARSPTTPANRSRASSSPRGRRPPWTGTRRSQATRRRRPTAPTRSTACAGGRLPRPVRVGRRLRPRSTTTTSPTIDHATRCSTSTPARSSTGSTRSWPRRSPHGHGGRPRWRATAAAAVIACAWHDGHWDDVGIAFADDDGDNATTTSAA